MTTFLQFVSSHRGQQFVMPANGLSDEVTGFMVGDVVYVWNVQFSNTFTMSRFFAQVQQ